MKTAKRLIKDSEETDRRADSCAVRLARVATLPRRTALKLKSNPTSSLAVSYQRLGRNLNQTRLKFSVALRPYIETIRTIRDGGPRTATSTLTQLQSSEILQFNVALRPRNHKDY